MTADPHDFAGMTVQEFCASLAARTPAPGGGAVAALTAAHSAALLAMVVAYARGKRVFATLEEQGNAIESSLRLAMATALAAAKSDADAYAALNALWKLPPEDPLRCERFPGAVRAAIAAPMLVVGLAVELAGTCRTLASHTAKALDSDLAIAADLAAAAARAAAWNVRANLPALASDDERRERSHVLDRALSRIDEDVVHVVRVLAEREG